MRALAEQLRGARPVRVRTPRDLLAGAGRLVLWLAIGLLVIRGVGATLAPARDERTPHAARVVAAPAWPDDAARALAVEFATVYLMRTPGEGPDVVAGRLSSLATPDVAGELAPQFDRDPPTQGVRSATVARTVRVDARHALITVAATLATGGQLGTRWLTVPVARDQAGGVVVDDLPSVAARPARGRVAARE